MTEKSLRREHRRSSFVHRLDEHRRPARLAGMVYPHPSFPLIAPSCPCGRRRRRHLRNGCRIAPAEAIAPLTAIHRIATAIRLRWAHDRSRQQLRELNDHLLKDIGLRRGDLGFEAPKPPWHRD